MTEASVYPSRPASASEDLTLPIAVYVLYLLALPTAGVSLLAGVIVAYASRDRAGPAARSHYEFAIRTFWLSLAAFVAGAAVCAVGAVLSVILIGIPILVVGGLMLVGVKVWYVVRCLLGILHAARRDPYPRPDALMA